MQCDMMSLSAMCINFGPEIASSTSDAHLSHNTKCVTHYVADELEVPNLIHMLAADVRQQLWCRIDSDINNCIKCTQLCEFGHFESRATAWMGVFPKRLAQVSYIVLKGASSWVSCCGHRLEI